jgi:hypothetical protein
MTDEMTSDDAVNVACIAHDVVHSDSYESHDIDVRQVAFAARQLVAHVRRLEKELDREHARARALERDGARRVEGHHLCAAKTAAALVTS